MALPDVSPLRASAPGASAAAGTAEERHWAATVAQLRQEVRREAEQATQRSGAADDPWIEFFTAPPSVAAMNADADDLLFFVYRDGCQPGPEPFFVRRKGSCMPTDVLSGPLLRDVDWRASLLLNIILQTSFSLTVSTCRRGSLAEVADAVPASGQMPAGVRWASHPVFASPMRVAMNLDASRTAAQQPAPSYPDVCFAADNFEDGIDEMVMEDPDECYAVMLEARAGVSFTALEAATQEPQSPPGHLLGLRPSPDKLQLGLSRLRSVSLGSSDLGHVDPGALAAWSEPSSIAEAAHGGVCADAQADAPPVSAADAAEQAAALDRAFSDPLLRPSNDVRAQKGGVPLQNGTAPSGTGGDPLRSVKQVPLPPSATAALSDGFEDVSLDDGGARAAHNAQADGPPETTGDSALRPKAAQRIVLFSGFVSYQQLLAVMAPTSSRAASFLGGIAAQRPHRVMMKGPGGQGCAEVAVTLLPPTQHGDEGHLTASSPTAAQVTVAVAPGKLDQTDADDEEDSALSQALGVRPNRLLARFASAARTARGVALEVIRGAMDDGGDDQHRLRCALMNLSLPVELIVQQLLAEP